MSNTPLTDAEMCDGWSGDAFAVSVEFARKLEKQLAERDEALARCVEALKPFGKMADPYESFDGQHDFLRNHVVVDHLGTRITVGDFRDARTVLASLPTSAQATAKVQQWQPIETAPKDKRILLGWVEGIFTGINCVIGRWEKHSYAKKPRPYWTHDLERLTSVSGTRRNQPTHWMPLPEPPESIREEQADRSSEKS